MQENSVLTCTRSFALGARTYTRSFALGALMVAVGFVPSLASAAEPLSAADRVKTVAPFVDEQTVAVAYVDTKRVDLDAIESFIVAMMGGAEREAQAEVHEPNAATMRQSLDRVAEAKRAASEWLASFAKAGGGDIYLVASLADLPEADKPFIVVPLAANADARALAGLLCSGKADGPTIASADNRSAPYPNMVSEQVGQAVFAGSRETLDRVRGMKPAARPELARAFEAAGDAPVQTIIVPTADNRRVIEEMMPALPEQLGGGPVTAVTRGLMWAAVAVQMKPAIACRVVVQSQDADAAQALKGVVDKALNGVGKEMAKLAETEVQGLDKLLAMLKPAVEGDRLTLALGAEAVTTTIGRTLAPPLARARLMARRTASMSNMKQLMMALFMYAADHKNEWPRDLQAVIDAKYTSAEVFVSPLQPERKAPYVYIRPAVPLNKIDPQLLVIYEAFDKWNEGTSVAFADGHVEFVADKAKFEQLLAKALKGAAEGEPTTEKK